MRPKPWQLYLTIAILTLFALVFVTPSHGRALAALEGSDLLSQEPTYTTSESVIVAVSGGSGDIVELRCPTASSRIGRLREIIVEKPSAACILTVVKRSSPDVAGTAGTPAMVPSDSTDVAASMLVQSYTAKPTAGTVVGTIRTYHVGTGDVLAVSFGDSNKKNTTIRPQESVALVTDTAGTFSYTLIWTEWPR